MARLDYVFTQYYIYVCITYILVRNEVEVVQLVNLRAFFKGIELYLFFSLGSKAEGNTLSWKKKKKKKKLLQR